MTDSRDNPTGETGGVAGVAAPDTATQGISRRALLRGATAAVPTVLTLNSGTALAMSSYYVSGSNTVEAVQDRFVCLDTKGQVGPRYYYGDGADAWAIHKDQLYIKASALQGVDLTKPQKILKAIERAPKYRGDQLCADGEQYVPLAYEGGLKLDGAGRPITRAVSVPRGALLSAAAFHSLDASGKLDTYLL